MEALEQFKYGRPLSAHPALGAREGAPVPHAVGIAEAVLPGAVEEVQLLRLAARAMDGGRAAGSGIAPIVAAQATRRSSTSHA